MWHIRPAEPEDAPALAALLRKEAPPVIVRHSILGCHGFTQHVAQTITLSRRHALPAFWIAEEGGAVIGVVEARWLPGTVFVNHLFVERTRRRRGLGTHLLYHAINGLARAKTDPLPQVALDVLADNDTAGDWYRRLGFQTVWARQWLLRPRPLRTEPPPGRWSVDGWPQAENDQAVFGFSQFCLHSENTSYQIGRLGSDLYRATDPALLSDPTALSALSVLDPRRDLLFVVRAEDQMAPAAENLEVVTVSLRLEAPLAPALERLRRTLQRRHAA